MIPNTTINAQFLSAAFSAATTYTVCSDRHVPVLFQSHSNEFGTTTCPLCAAMRLPLVGSDQLTRLQSRVTSLAGDRDILLSALDHAITQMTETNEALANIEDEVGVDLEEHNTAVSAVNDALSDLTRAVEALEQLDPPTCNVDEVTKHMSRRLVKGLKIVQDQYTPVSQRATADLAAPLQVGHHPV